MYIECAAPIVQPWSDEIVSLCRGVQKPPFEKIAYLCIGMTIEIKRESPAANTQALEVAVGGGLWLRMIPGLNKNIASNELLSRNPGLVSRHLIARSSFGFPPTANHFKPKQLKLI